MNRSIQSLLVIIFMSVFATAALAAAAATPAAAPAPTAAAKGPRPPAPYDKLNLTDAQKPQFAATVHEKRAAIAEWETDHGVRRAELKKEVTDARAAHEDEKAKALIAEGVEIDKERKAIEDKYQAALENILTLEQHQELEGLAEYSLLMQRFSRLKPTDKQREEIKARVLKAAPDAYGKNAKIKGEVWESVRVDIQQNVLTPEQRLLLKPAPTTHPHPH